MKLFKTLTAAAVLLVAGSQAAMALSSINGRIDIGGDPGTTLTWNGGIDVAFSGGSGNSIVNLVTGDFDTVLDNGDDATYYSFNSVPTMVWAATNGADSASFTATKITAVNASVAVPGVLAILSIQGSGIASLDGFLDTGADWVLTAQASLAGVGTKFKFEDLVYTISSTTVATPDSGSTVALLGLGLLGLAAVARRRK